MKFLALVPGFTMEILIELYYFFSLLETRWNKRKTCVVYLLIACFNAVKSYFMFEQPLLKGITSFFIILGAVCILFKDKWYKKIIVFLVYWLCNFLGEFTALLMMKYILKMDFISASTPGNLGFVFLAVITYSLVLIYNIIGILILKKNKINYNNRTNQYIFLYIAVQGLMLFILMMLIYQYKIIPDILLILVIVFMLGSIIIGILLYKSAKTVVEKEYEAKFIKKVAELKDKQFIELKKQYTEYRRLKHDFYNHIKILENMDDPEKIKEYSLSMKEKFDNMDSVSYCDNLTVDALLNFKKREAERENIKTDFNICNIDDVKISNMDISIILSNLIDNAIEGASKTDEKYIDLEITRKLDRLIIRVKNSSLPVLSDLETTKTDKENHGIGLSNIKNTAKKYNGNTVFKYENNEFLSIVNLKIK